MSKKNPPRQKVKLKQLRQAAGHTQESLAAAVGIRIKTAADWENHGTLPSFENAVKVARVLHVTLYELARAFDIDVEGIPEVNEAKPQEVTISQTSRRVSS